MGVAPAPFAAAELPMDLQGMTDGIAPDAANPAAVPASAMAR
eukprot:CAMPEP_0115126090 /NCGR_PEP_ID=MMETSP0227-20121206/49478_1 /TAXON_ID=89957 /ORGANISM="Polarella glacialis, Strain CCMP 1383" /LENGTH=41 /DNA_ID= /DNA_START= /DNA_END= /DNA_ORIENTATION=